MSITLKPSGVVYWFRFSLAIVVGLLSYILHLSGIQGFTFMILFFIISYYIVRYGFKFGEDELKGKNKRVMIGIGTYIFVWAATWVFTYTLYPYPLP